MVLTVKKGIGWKINPVKGLPHIIPNLSSHTTQLPQNGKNLSKNVVICFALISFPALFQA
jgi:hypothetical protein